MKVYMLTHIADGDYGRTKLLGLFAARERAEKACESYLLLEGFRDYPKDFSICALRVDVIERRNTEEMLLGGRRRYRKRLKVQKGLDRRSESHSSE
jgi:hypothetical protein